MTFKIEEHSIDPSKPSISIRNSFYVGADPDPLRFKFYFIVDEASPLQTRSFTFRKANDPIDIAKVGQFLGAKHWMGNTVLVYDISMTLKV